MLFSKTPSLKTSFSLAFIAFACALQNGLDGTLLPADAAEKSPVREASKTSGQMHQVDFILAHASCPSCILKVRAALRATAGVVKCEIALRKPYGGVVIYEPAKVDLARLKDVATQADPNHVVDMTEVKEKTISAVPKLLVPFYMFKGNVPQASQ